MNTSLVRNGTPVQESNNTLSSQTQVKQEPEQGKVDFRSLLAESNQTIKKQRDLEEKQGLSGTESYDKFLETLSQNGPIAAAPKNKMDKDDFLTLFVAQLQNQDPLQPKDGTEMSAQLAQFNSLEQMMNMNKSLERMEESNKSDRQLQWVSYLGKDVLVKDQSAGVRGGNVQETYFVSQNEVKNATLKITDQDGNIVYEKKLGSFEPGRHPVQWDGTQMDGGKAKDGRYKVEVTTSDGAGSEVPLETVGKLKITGIDLKDKEKQFTTDVGKIGSSDILAINEPADKEAKVLSPPPSSAKP
ncbi:MAG: flagellar hook assembly protein FlgD [Deltaproteobacteria bacterium]|nr:flagellar hook assembly protein FlgD [Deltaproteobacteria bacterium]